MKDGAGTIKEEGIRITPFIEPLMEILKAHPLGIKEFYLIKELEKRGFPEFTTDDHMDDLKTFRIHFFLFHILYRLKGILAEKQEGFLSIHCLEIVLHPYREAACHNQPVRPDPLQAYYLDLKNLEETDAGEVEKMLERFWRHYFAPGGREQALEVLGLTESATPGEIKKRYHLLARQHHPDAGGDGEMFRKINEAMELISPWD